MKDATVVDKTLSEQVTSEMFNLLRREGKLPVSIITKLEQCDLTKHSNIVDILNCREDVDDETS